MGVKTSRKSNQKLIPAPSGLLSVMVLNEIKSSIF